MSVHVTNGVPVPGLKEVREYRETQERLASYTEDHVERRTVIAIGKVPPKVVTIEYLDRLTDLACTRYHRAVSVDKPGGAKAMERYTEARRALREAWQRFSAQAEEAGAEMERAK